MARLTEEEYVRLGRLRERMRARLGLKVSDSDAVRAGLLALEKEYPGDEGPPPETEKRRARGPRPAPEVEAPAPKAKRKGKS